MSDPRIIPITAFTDPSSDLDRVAELRQIYGANIPANATASEVLALAELDNLMNGDSRIHSQMDIVEKLVDIRKAFRQSIIDRSSSLQILADRLSRLSGKLEDLKAGTLSL